MKSILIVANYVSGRGGISGQVDYLYRYLKQLDDYHVEVFSTKGSLVRRTKFFFSLLVRARHFDVLHVHGCSDRGFLPIVYGVVAGKLWKKRLVVTYHGGDANTFFSRHPKWVSYWLNKADECVVLSGFLKNVFDDFNIPSKVIPNVVELNRDVFKEKSMIMPRFISVRHLRELYNIPCIIKAFEEVQRNVPEATLTLLGDGDKRKELEDYVEKHGVKNVCFVGQVPNAVMVDYLQNCDVMLSAPRADNMPLSVLEAFSAGVLVISSNVGGVPYIVEHERTGLLFESDNSLQLSERMLWALSHQQESLQMIRNAKAETEKYSWKAVGKKILDLYEQTE